MARIPNKEVLPHVIYGSLDKPLQISGFEIPCFVLSDERRVLTQRGLSNALGISIGGGKGGVHRMARFIGSKSLSPFIVNELRVSVENPIKFRGVGGESYGFEATILVDICDAIIEARNNNSLQNQQSHIAQRAEVLIRGFAKTGIIALVDEATGYQQVREQDALQLFLQKFLENEKGKWIRTFPPEFFEAIFKMKGWTWKQASTKKPQVVGHYINNYVYSRLAPKILDELRERAPKDEKGNRKGKFPQWINPDFGHPKLKEHLNTLTAFARASGFNWLQWDRMVKRAFPKFESDGSAVRELDFPE